MMRSIWRELLTPPDTSEMLLLYTHFGIPVELNSVKMYFDYAEEELYRCVKREGRDHWWVSNPWLDREEAP